MGKDGMEKQRIWELDALRGLCICGMVSVHFCINAGWMGVLPAPASWLFQAVRIGGGLIFIALSGLCSKAWNIIWCGGGLSSSAAGCSSHW